jgi:hypothetical protein
MSDSTTTAHSGKTQTDSGYIATLTPNQLRLLAIIVARLKQEEAAA